MTERTLILAFLAGFLPTAAFSVWLLSLLRSRCRALRNERDTWKLACEELERLSADTQALPPGPSPARIEGRGARAGEHSDRMEEELLQLREEHTKVLHALAGEKERIGRVVRDLRSIREAWLDSRKLLTEASTERRSE
jgi:hypothetical protein